MTTVPHQTQHGWWNAAPINTGAEFFSDLDDPKSILDSLLREIAMSGKLTPEAIQ